MEHTVVATPWLCPELSMRITTAACPLWRADEQQLALLDIGEPYWAFCWPGGQALARYILDHPQQFAGRDVVAFGAGGGVEAIAAARAGARSVTATDIDPLAVAAVELNAALNAVDICTDCDDWIGRDVPHDIVLVGDVTYESPLARRVLDWLESVASQGTRVLIGDPGRGHIPSQYEAVAVYDAPADVDLDGRYLVRTTIWTISV